MDVIEITFMAWPLLAVSSGFYSLKIASRKGLNKYIWAALGFVFGPLALLIVLIRNGSKVKFNSLDEAHEKDREDQRVFHRMYWRSFNIAAKVVGSVFLLGGLLGFFQASHELYDDWIAGLAHPADKGFRFAILVFVGSFAVIGLALLLAKPYNPDMPKKTNRN